MQNDTADPKAVLLSVIVPAFNIADYIKNCIASIVEQSFKDVEVIVIDDGSTDSTRDELACFETNPRVQIVEQDNSGQAVARNVGIARSTGHYLMFVDGDDALAQGALEKIANCLLKDDNIDLVVFDWWNIWRNRRSYESCKATFWDLANNPFNKVYCRRLWIDEEFPVGLWYEDLAVVPYIFLKAQRAVKIDDALYLYLRERTGSQTVAVDAARFFDLITAAVHCVQLVDRLIEQHPGITQQIGREWRQRFYTRQLYQNGMLNKSLLISSGRHRRQFIREFVAAMGRSISDADRRIDIPELFRYSGITAAAGGFLYSRGHFMLGDILWRYPRVVRGLFRKHSQVKRLDSGHNANRKTGKPV